MTVQLGAHVGQQNMTMDEMRALWRRLDEAGPQILTVRVRGDQLPGDNTFNRVIFVRDSIRVLLVDGNPNPAAPTESASHFVRNALTPVPEARTQEYFVRPEVFPASAVSAGMLANFDVVYLLNAPAGTAADNHDAVLCRVTCQENLPAGGDQPLSLAGDSRPACDTEWLDCYIS